MIRYLNTQQLTWLLTSLAVVLATHSPNLPIWVIATSVFFGAWRYLINKNQWSLPKFWQLLPITILICLGIIFSFKGFFGRDASLSLLVVMCSLKFLETKTLRDYMLVIVLGYFLVGNLFLFNQNIVTFLLSIPPLILLTATLINTSLHNSQPIQFSLKLAGQLLLQAIPVMLILFVLFPRIPGPIWGLPQDANSGMSGLGDSLSFGNISNLTQNSSIAFRVQFKDAIPANNQLYWRGPVLWHQENENWTMSSPKIDLSLEKLTTQGTPTHYTITLEPHNRLWLLMLDMPTMIPRDAKLSHDYSAIAEKPVRTRIRYDAISFNEYQLGMDLNEREKILSLQINAGENPKTIQLAKTWANLNTQDKVNRALDLYRQQDFYYTLRPPRLGKNPVDDFLFNTKRGFCEHYATSFVYLMRAAGVPARIVTGYQGGEFNPNGDYLIVRQSDAHAWAEVWLVDKGWVRIDPTAAVSPERIEFGISEALSNSDELPLMARKDYPWLKKAYLSWDGVNNGWNQWVLGYDDKKQLDFLKKLSGKNLNLQDMLIWMMGIIALIMAATTYFLLKQNNVKLKPAQRLYAQYLNQLKRVGLTPYPAEAALDFAQRAATDLTNHKQLIIEIAQRYNVLMYSASPKPELLSELAQCVKQLQIKKRS
ncbi:MULTISPECIES: transglutaminase TgpA family protein [Methylotenera]|uniref:transglutaminase TgpA family protein n=1 Tax=Methylotenera TaxID=359407 RepID=UPI00036630B9|nr:MULTISPECIES: DUF3488 and transglutaminase-like domain-containing protein [Methylotenera]